MDWRHIDGWFTTGDDGINRHLAGVAPDGPAVTLGVYQGRSVVAMANAFRDAGRLDAMTLVGIDYFHAANLPIAARNLRDIPRLRLVRANIIDAAAEFADGSVSVVFLDASHDYQSTRAAIAAWRPKLTAGGILCGHDYQPNWPGVVRAVDEAFPQGVNLFGTCWMASPLPPCTPRATPPQPPCRSPEIF